MRKINLTDLLTAIISTELVGAVSALLSGGYGIYQALNRPPFSPSAWVFPVVWAVLYALMGISLYIISRSDSRRRKSAAKLYIIQLAVNFSWSIIFFRFRLFTLAAVIAVILAVLVGIMVCYFGSIKKSAGIINIPYFIWSAFAAYLAIGTALLN